MRLVTYKTNSEIKIGLLTSEQNHVLPLQTGEKHYLGTTLFPNEMVSLLNQGEEAIKSLLKLEEKLAADPATELLLPIEQIQLLAPIQRTPKNIFCVGKNYREHVKEMAGQTSIGGDIPAMPVIFTKAPTSIIGPNDFIESYPELTQTLDYEVELAVVIGKTGKNIPEEAAMDYVFGYTIANDVTARDRQKAHHQWFLGKGLDTFSPMGPHLVHKNEIPDLMKVTLTSKVNGELRQSGCVADLIFSVAHLIATISSGLTLEPGDMILTGTPAGVGAGFNPPKFLKSGDLIELEINPIGLLINTVK